MVLVYITVATSLATKYTSKPTICLVSGSNVEVLASSISCPKHANSVFGSYQLPLVPFTDEPPTLVGNPVSWFSAMCLLCLEILNSAVELVTCGSIVCSICFCAWLDIRHELCVPVVMGIT